MRFRSLTVFVALLCCGVVGAGVMRFVSARTVFARTVSAQEASKGGEPGYVSPPAKANVTLPEATVTIDYCAPSVHGRTIYGGLVPYGKVWRTGANAATTLKTTGALQIGGLKVAAGTYTLYSVPAPDGWKLVVNKQTGQWGTVYDKAQDLGRVAMETASTAMPVETMVIDFEKTMGNATELHVKWADVDASVQIAAAK
jgi:hypothetical protein